MCKVLHLQIVQRDEKNRTFPIFWIRQAQG